MNKRVEEIYNAYKANKRGVKNSSLSFLPKNSRAYIGEICVCPTTFVLKKKPSMDVMSML